MKPIEKYQEKFVELLKEAEAELGDYLTVKVCSSPLGSEDMNRVAYNAAYKKVESKIYAFELHTNSYVI